MKTKCSKEIITCSPEETIEFAASVARSLGGGALVALVGDLGAGKTVFVKGIAKGLGIAEYEYVNSPTFVILKEYSGKRNLYHFDVYRIDAKSFCETLDYEKYFYGSGVTVVEWADKISDILPEEYLEITMEHVSITERKIKIRPVGERFRGFTHSPRLKETR